MDSRAPDSAFYAIIAASYSLDELTALYRLSQEKASVGAWFVSLPRARANYLRGFSAE